MNNLSLRLFLDARLSNCSGIGRFICNIIFGLDQLGVSGNLLTQLSTDFKSCKSFYYSSWKAPIYSFSEQLGHPAFWTAMRRGYLIHAPHFNHPIFAPAPHILTIYDLTHLEFPELFSKKQIALLKLLLPFTLYRARLIHAISQSTADSLIKFYPFTQNKIRVIHLGIESKFSPAHSDEALPATPYFLYVGNLKPHKNLTSLLDAFALVVSDLPSYRLKIIGKDFLSEQLAKEVRSRNLHERVDLEGELDENLLLNRYRHATALVHPSLAEGFGFTPLEAMACGTPALVSRAGSLPEVCGDAALYFDPHKPEEIAARMKQIVVENNLRQEMIEHGLQHVKKFTWKKCVDGIVELYREAAAKK
ncbi:glycosyltransferase family 1 protein [Oscillatoria amoena NRMC-F 0135]|nr:glycosyltransferase family 1 protein [Oscillatoria laete-virens]MDL5046620.1 glycosyltransferase family 1 protein [Oscillatoria amoena NRMC-F 0135]MDL5053607.1 glycosyltransferase family 1 protein [Oscillatoria laete-virens NRMC-F 0139]